MMNYKSWLLSLSLLLIQVVASEDQSLARALTLTGDRVCVPSIAGQKIPVGFVCFSTSNGGESLVVSYETTSPWGMSVTHLWTGFSLEDYPQAGGGNPKLGNFPYGCESFKDPKSCTIEIPLSEITKGTSCGCDVIDSLYLVPSGRRQLRKSKKTGKTVSSPNSEDSSNYCTLLAIAHAAVGTIGGSGSSQETAYSLGESLPGGSWAMYTSIGLKCDDDSPTPKPTTKGPTTPKPTTPYPTSKSPTTKKPTTKKPTKQKPTKSPTTAKPTTAKPTTTKPTSRPSTTAQPTNTPQPTSKPTSRPTSTETPTTKPTPQPTSQPINEDPSRVCANAFARYEPSNTCMLPSRWGWTNGPISVGTQTSINVYAGGSDCDSNLGRVGGSVQLMYMDIGMSLFVEAQPGSSMRRLAIYVGDEPLPVDGDGNPSTNPEDYTIYLDYNVDSPFTHMHFFRRLGQKRMMVGEISDPRDQSYDQVDFPDISGDKYVIVWMRNCLYSE